MHPANTLVANRLVAGEGALYAKVNPSTEAAIEGIRQSSLDQVEAAITGAHQAAKAWRSTPPQVVAALMQRAARILGERKAALAQVGAEESGITATAIAGMVDQAVAWLQYYAGWVDKFAGERSVTPEHELHYNHSEPYGVIGVITPSNSTVSAMVLPPILAARNTVVFKTPEFTSQVMAQFLQCFVEAGFPPGVINCVTGDAAVGEAVTAHPLVNKVHFTGSPHVGKLVGMRCAQQLKPCTLELGGKSANIICADADVERSVEIVFRALTRQSGQSCVAGTRVIVHASLAQQVLDQTIAALRSLRMGDAQSLQTDFGPVVSRAAYQKIQAEIARATAEGDGVCATQGLFDGQLPRRGFFIPPTIFDRVDNASALAQVETFGPVISLIHFQEVEEAIQMANDSAFGLAGYVQTASLKNAMQISQQLDTGIIWVNGCQGIKPYMAFGGVKDSGFGRSGGPQGMQEFLKSKSVWMAM